MATISRTDVEGREKVVDTMIKKVGRWLCFKTEWWEIQSTESLGSDIYIVSTRPIRQIYFNGEPVNKD